MSEVLNAVSLLKSNAIAKGKARLEPMNLGGGQSKKWSRANFLDKAQELTRRLDVWQIDGKEPVYCPRDIVEFQRALKSVFRDRVMLGEHEDQLDFTTQSIVGNAFIKNPIDPYAKYITIWMFRDFVEHLDDLGDSEQAKFVRLKVDRLLDSPMNAWGKSEVFGDYIMGCEVEPSLLTEFISAVSALELTVEGDESGLSESLDPNSKSILQAMFEINCTELNRTSGKEIIKVALCSGDEKRAFDQLKRLDLIASKLGKNGGYWLTSKGRLVAKKLKELSEKG